MNSTAIDEIHEGLQVARDLPAKVITFLDLVNLNDKAEALSFHRVVDINWIIANGDVFKYMVLKPFMIRGEKAEEYIRCEVFFCGRDNLIKNVWLDVPHSQLLQLPNLVEAN